MKRFLRFLLWFVGTAIFLLATAHVTLRHLLNAPKFKAAALARLERTTGRPVACGRIDYELFPFGLVVRDVALKEKDGAQDFASIRAFSAAIDFRKKEISALRFDRPTLRIVRNADGTYNFSDLLAAPAAAAPRPAPRAPAGPRPPAQAAAPPLAIRLVQIVDAQFEFVRKTADGGAESCALSHLDFTLRDVAADRPLRMEGRAAIGRASRFEFVLTGPAPAEYADRPGAWPLDLDARLEIGDAADVEALLASGAFPFPNLHAALNVHGALADHLHAALTLRTAESAADSPNALDLALDVDLSLPPPVAAHLFGGAELPAGFRFAPAPCAPPPGAISLTENPELALFLRHAQGQAHLAFPKIAWGQNIFERGAAQAFLRGGVLTVPTATCAAYGGTLEARGNAQLLACPLTYRLDRLTADQLDVGRALAANGLAGQTKISGALHLEASGSGQAVAEPGLRTLVADAQARIDDLQTVGPGGSLMDQVWRQLDQPLLLKIAPRLKAKVAEAQRTATAIATTRYETATATLALRAGVATLSDARLAMPGYRLDLAGPIWPFDDRLDLAAQLVASPAETAQLVGDQDLSALLPYEDGGLLVPLAVRGALSDPQAVPDLDRLLQHALGGGGGAGAGGDSPLDELSASDRKHVEKGLEFLGTLLAP